MTALLVLGGGALAVAFPALVASDPYFLYIGGAACLWAALATAWALLAYAGQVSFGQAAFFGVGAYTSALLAQRAGLSPWLGVVTAGLAGAVVAAPVGLGAHRLRGAYLALGTLGYAEALRLVALNWAELTGGGSGLVGIPELSGPGLGAGLALSRGRAGSYYVALALLLGVLGLAAGLRRGRVGLAWAAIREREERASQLGLATTRYKVLAFVCSGAVTAVGGAVYAHAVRFIEPDLVFGRSLSLLPLVMATFGGALPLLGPACGALVLYLGSELIVQPLLPRFHQLPYALALIATVLVLPRGLASLGWHPR
jgi:branched-chain amino acid transport system permease protein